MKRADRLWKTSIFAMACLLGVVHWFQMRHVYAQQNSRDYDDGNVYVYASVNVDSNYYLYTDSFAALDFEADEDIDLVDDEIWVDVDQDVQYDDYADPDEDRSEYPPLKFGPVSPGYEYGVRSIGSVCVDDGEDDCDWYDEDSAYASVNVQYPPPQITKLSTYSVNQGDQGTLTVNGTNFIINGSDQLRLTFSGSSNPFTLASVPSPCTSQCTATFTYDFTGYTPGTYNLWVQNNEGESEPVSFTVNTTSQGTTPALPPNPCAVTSDPKVSFSSIVPSGSAGPGMLSISFSGPAFAATTSHIPYGPYSTPESVASSIAATVTKNYARYGMVAKALGSKVIYAGTSTVGNVSINGGSSFATDVSSSAATAVANACFALPTLPCPGSLGFWNYNNINKYRTGDATAKAHIISRHIDNTPSSSTTVYANTRTSLINPQER